MRRTAVLPALVAFVAGTSAVAFAQEPKPGCPPGAWFCAEAPGVGSVTAAPAGSGAPAPASSAQPPTGGAPPATRTPPPSRDTFSTDQPGNAPPGTVYLPAQPPGQGAPPIVVYQQPPPPPPTVVYVPPPPPRVYRVEPPPPPPPPPRRDRSEWAFGARLEGVMMQSGAARDAGMGGIGFSLRPRPSPHFALDIGLDFLGGTDYNGKRRSEWAIPINAMLFLNPRSRVQVYFLMGLGFGGATVREPDQPAMMDGRTHYSYFGGDMGGGIEWRLSRRVALDLDLVGFIRGRTDAGARDKPEFTHPETGQTTNTSGGGLLRAGLMFYW